MSGETDHTKQTRRGVLELLHVPPAALILVYTVFFLMTIDFGEFKTVLILILLDYLLS